MKKKDHWLLGGGAPEFVRLTYTMQPDFYFPSPLSLFTPLFLTGVVMLPCLASDLQSFYFSLPRPGTLGVHHHASLFLSNLYFWPCVYQLLLILVHPLHSFIPVLLEYSLTLNCVPLW